MFLYGKYTRFVKSVDMDSYRAYAFAHPNRFDGRVLSYFNLRQRSIAAYEMAKEESQRHKEHPLNIPHSRWVWVHHNLPPYREHFYNFSYFALTLNEIEPYIEREGICPTDSRFRPDVRHYENGNAAAAEAIKGKLEDAQRARAKERKETWKPRWFYPAISPYTGEETWLSNGEYWNRVYPADATVDDIFKV